MPSIRRRWRNTNPITHGTHSTDRPAKIAPIVNADYHVVHINIGNYDHNMDIGERYDVPLKKGVPAVAVLDGKGKLLTSQQNREFESAVKIGPADVTAFLEKWKPGATADN